jgi:2-(1,2-epoxy-1,2-dihydrophenyl)acetyl-CoA isomerase
MTDIVKSTLEDGVAIIAFNRPETSNAMSLALGDAFLAAVERYAADPATRAWLIRAEGKNFCAGGDMTEFIGADDPSEQIGKMARRLHDSLILLHNHRAPVVMAIQGAAAGAGFSMVAGADVAIAGRSASFLWAYTTIGLTCDGGSTWHLPRVIGMRRAQELAYTGRRLTADEAADIGLVTRVVDDEVLAEESLKVAKAIARGPTGAYGKIKQLFDASLGNDFETQLGLEVDSIMGALAGKDAQGAVRAFIEKRKPEFTGE